MKTIEATTRTVTTANFTAQSQLVYRMFLPMEVPYVEKLPKGDCLIRLKGMTIGVQRDSQGFAAYLHDGEDTLGMFQGEDVREIHRPTKEKLLKALNGELTRRTILKAIEASGHGVQKAYRYHEIDKAVTKLPLEDQVRILRKALDSTSTLGMKQWDALADAFGYVGLEGYYVSKSYESGIEFKRMTKAFNEMAERKGMPQTNTTEA